MVFLAWPELSTKVEIHAMNQAAAVVVTTVVVAVAITAQAAAVLAT
jgi:hypothetical protein